VATEKHVVKFKSVLGGIHVETRIFIGPHKDFLAYAGRFKMRFEEWHAFMELIAAGSLAVGFMEVITEGDLELYDRINQQGRVHAGQKKKA
jgi:hypothetical protein